MPIFFIVPYSGRNCNAFKQILTKNFSNTRQHSLTGSPCPLFPSTLNTTPHHLPIRVLFKPFFRIGTPHREPGTGNRCRPSLKPQRLPPNPIITLSQTGNRFFPSRRQSSVSNRQTPRQTQSGKSAQAAAHTPAPLHEPSAYIYSVPPTACSRPPIIYPKSTNAFLNPPAVFSRVNNHFYSDSPQFSPDPVNKKTSALSST